MSRRQLGIFVRCPVPGTVKTRLTPALSAEDACALYRACIAETCSRIEKTASYRVTVFHDGDEPELLDGIVPERARRVPQTSGTLGQRLTAAFDTLFSSGRGPAVIIGSDSPDMSLVSLRRACTKLKHRDVVLGPAMDGGYYLVGLSRPLPDLFDDIPWGTDRVLDTTMDRIERGGYTLASLPLWYDLDTPDDAHRLFASVRARRIEGRERLKHLEAAFESIGFKGRK